jgi:hypothetical protein
MAPAKEKLAGERLNSAGIESLNQPDADTRGDDPLIAKAGTRGMTKARVMPMLTRERARMTKTRAVRKTREERKHARDASGKDDEHHRAAGEPSLSENAILSAVERPPLHLESLRPFLSPRALGHALQLVLSPLGTERRYRHHLHGSLWGLFVQFRRAGCGELLIASRANVRRSSQR